jgi:2,3-bisphosphoglycerate-dependent phosphoglycerate mutase
VCWSSVTRILLARHGETDWNRESRWQGHADIPLNETGREQAHELGRALAETSLDAVYSSDLLRAYETAEIVARPRGFTVIRDAALREIDDREWTGLTWPEIEQAFPEGARRHQVGGTGWEHGETWAAMTERVIAALDRIAARHPDGCVLCVIHGGPIRVSLAHAMGLDLREYRRTQPEPANGSVSEIAVEEGAFRRID